MTFLRVLGWIDTWALASTLAQTQRRQQLKGEDGAKMLVVREEGAEGHPWTHPDLAKWAAMKNAIGRAGRILAEQSPQLKIARVAVELLEPGAVLPWFKDDAPEIDVHVGLVHNPWSMLFAGNEGLNVMPGQIVAHGRDVWHSSVNLGTTSRVHLVLTLKKRESEE
jgi:hypothetical protein